MPFELIPAEQAIFLRLTTSPTADALKAIMASRWYADKAPPKPDYPYGLYSEQGNADHLTDFNKERNFTEPVYWIRIVTRLDGNTSTIPSDVRTAVGLMDDLIQTMRRQTYGSISGYSFGAWRESQRKIRERDPANAAGEIIQLGGEYRLQVIPTT